VSAAAIGPIMKPKFVQSAWMLSTWQPAGVSSSSAAHDQVDEQVDASYFWSFAVAWAAIRRVIVPAVSSPCRIHAAASRQAVRDASEPNSAAGVPLPEQPVVPAWPLVDCTGMNQLGTSPVASH